MKMFLPFFFCTYFASSALLGTEHTPPPREIPPHLHQEYTLNSQIPVHSWYLDNSYPPEIPCIFTTQVIDRMISQAVQRHSNYYGVTDQWLYAMFSKYSDSIKGKKVAIIGSTTPWYECIVLAYGGHPVTIEYNKIICSDPRIEVMTVEEYAQNPQVFDAILSVSSIEHDGLGRYGDPINPQGDLETMSKSKTMLKKDGLFFLSVPIGRDTLYWNAGRLYGKLRLPLLLKGWDMIDSAGFSQSDLTNNSNMGHQPVLVLRCSES